MGEVKIKSGNLVESYVADNNKNRYIAVLYAEADLKPNTTYTIALTINEGYDVYFNEKVFSNWSAFTGDGTYQVFALTTRSDLTKNNNTYTSGKGWWILKNNKYQANFINVSDFQILEGTYTPETIPEYQLYFLNRPAHQVTNGEWIDIPTHHYTNGRWQGELTSQSPLKFRADGEMLDWRIEGKTSGNLFDVKHFVDTAYCHNVVLTQLDNGIRIQATSSNDPYANYVNGVIGQTLPVNMRNTVIPCKSNTDYTLHCAQSSRIGKYISYFDKDYKVVKNYTPFSGTPINFKTPETCVYILLRIGDSSTLSEGTTIELTNIQILEGTYTTSTLPPYEPYGGVGDWDEGAQKYRIPVTVEGENLFDGELEQGGVSISGGNVSSAARVRGYANVKPLTAYTITANKAFRLCYGYNYDGLNLERVGLIFDNNSGNNKLSTFTTPEGCNYIRFAMWNGDESNIIPTDIQNLILIEGAYTASTIPPYEVNLFTDHQLMDGDSIDYATDQTAIPIATGNNTLSVDTAVQPSKVFVKFEG